MILFIYAKNKKSENKRILILFILQIIKSVENYLLLFHLSKKYKKHKEANIL